MATTNRAAAKSTAAPVQTPAPTVPAVPNTPVKAPESAASVASRVAPLDLSALSGPVAIKRPERHRVGGTGRVARDNSVVEKWLADVEETRKAEPGALSEARAINVPLSGLSEMQSRFVTASEVLKVGVSLSLISGERIPVAIKAFKDGIRKGDETVTLVYYTQKRKANKPKVTTPAPVTTPPATPPVK